MSRLVFAIFLCAAACGAPPAPARPTPTEAPHAPPPPSEEERAARARAEVEALVARWSAESDEEDADVDFDPSPHVEQVTRSVALVWRQTGYVDGVVDDASEIADSFEAVFVGPNGAVPAPTSLFVSQYESETGSVVGFESMEPEIERHGDVQPEVAVVAPAELVMLDPGASAPLLVIEPAARAIPLQCEAEVVAATTACGVTIGCNTLADQPLGVVRGAELDTGDACVSDLSAIVQAVQAATVRAWRHAAELLDLGVRSPLPPQCPAPPTARRLAARDRIAQWLADEHTELPAPFGELWQHVNFSCTTANGAFGVRLRSGDADVALFWVGASGSVEPLYPPGQPEVTASTEYVDLDGDGTREWMLYVDVDATTAYEEARSETHVISRFGVLNEAERALAPVETTPGHVVLAELEHPYVDAGPIPRAVWLFDAGQLTEVPSGDPIAERIARAEAIETDGTALIETLWTAPRSRLAALDLARRLGRLGVPEDEASRLGFRLRARFDDSD